MMKNFLLSIFSLISIFVNLIHSAAWSLPANRNHLKGRSGVCYESKYKFGYMEHEQEKTARGKCVNVVCSKYDSSITYMECGDLECEYERSEGDHTKQYPWCCPTCMD